MADIPVFVTSDQTSSERRISPSWTITELKGRLETITGIPPGSQQLQVYASSTATSTPPVKLDSSTVSDEDKTTIGQFNLTPYGRIHVDDSRPPTVRGNYNDVSQVEKYVMPEHEYERLGDSVLAWKRKNHLGRFGTGESTSEDLASKLLESAREEIDYKGIAVGKRCRIISPGNAAAGSERRGEVKFVGPVAEIKGHQSMWVGIELDEPLGKNNGTIQGVRYFQAKPNHGSFAKPSNVEVGDFPELDPFAEDDEEEL